MENQQEEAGSNPSAVEIPIIASRKKISDFTDKDYLVDISLGSLFVTFPDLTFIIGIKYLVETP